MATSQQYVLNKLYGNVHPEHLIGLECEYKSVYNAMRNTIVQRRGHQCILLGARATGKSMVINSALKEISSEFSDQFLTVKINGLCHSDDKLALREIAKQLDAAITNGDEPIEKPSMSLTLKSINQLFEKANSDALENEDSNLKPMSVIFIIEELDRYTTAHQVLAYELFELSQTSPIGVTVIATSARLNVVDSLEKRNRSRNNAVVHTLPKPASIEQLITIGNELLSNPANERFIEPEVLQEIATSVRQTTNSVRHLASLLVPHVLGITDVDILQQSTSELLLTPFDTIPELDWAMLICAARAVARYETQCVNLVIVLDEWRALASLDHANRFAEMTTHIYSQVDSSPGPHTPSVHVPGKPGSTPSTLRAVRYSWERLHQLGMIEPTTSQSTQQDLKMYVPELDLDDLREILPRTYSLYSWTRIE